MATRQLWDAGTRPAPETSSARAATMRVVGATAIALAASMAIQNAMLVWAGAPAYGDPIEEVLAWHGEDVESFIRRRHRAQADFALFHCRDGFVYIHAFFSFRMPSTSHRIPGIRQMTSDSPSVAPKPITSVSRYVAAAGSVVRSVSRIAVSSSTG